MLNYFILLISVPFALKLLEYRPSVNFGQIFYDYSENFQSGVNGFSSSTTISDTIATDRGAYFQDNTGVITMPPNDVILSSFSLPIESSLVLWVNVLLAGTIFYMENSFSDHLRLIALNPPYSLDLQLQVSGVPSSNPGGLLIYGK